VFEDIRVELCDHWGASKQVAHQAWASTYDVEKLAQKTDADVRRVVSDVIAHRHGTPKERAWMDFFITCPIYIERQFDKYRMTVQYQGVDVEFFLADMGRENLTQNELSGRYRTIPDRFIEMPSDVLDITGRARPNSDDAMGRLSMAEEYSNIMEWQYTAYSDQLRELKKARDETKTITAAEFKRAREFLRGQLGTGFLTDMRILCNMHSFEWIMEQRLAPDAQLEGQVVALRMLKAALAHPELGEMVQQLSTANCWDAHISRLEALGV